MGGTDNTRRNLVIDTTGVESICELHDDLYRNQLITYAYDCISRRLADQTGGHANWFTFARWSSFTVGENLRTDRPSKAFTDLVEGRPWLRPVRSPLTRLNQSTRTRNDAAMPRTLALGNRLVFHEIAHAVVAFLEWFDDAATGKRTVDEWRAYRRTITGAEATDLFPACDIGWLRDGIEAYFLAILEPDPGRRSRLVLRGNVMLAAYEQWRLQPIVALALDPIAKTLVGFADTDMHSDQNGPRAVLRRAGTPWAFRHRNAIGQFAMERYQHFMTHHVMAWEGPITPSGTLSFGRGIPDTFDSGVDGPIARAIDDLTDPNLAILKVFDRSDGKAAGRTAENWARFPDRMNFIVHLFRAGHDVKALFATMSERELRIVDLDLSDANLDRLRTIGDPPADDLLERLTIGQAGDPRALVHRLIRDTVPEDDDWYGPGEAPEWVEASTDRLEQGRRFLREYGAEIGAAMFFAALPFSYTAARGAHVLTRTAELTTGHTSRRLAETGQLLLDLMAFEEEHRPLGPGTQARRSVEGVRLFHAAVRRMIDVDPTVDWDTADLGVPINQEDLIGTLVVFTVVVVDSLEKLGIDFDDPDMSDARDAYAEYWLAVGAVLGIDYRQLRRSDVGGTAPPLTLEELRLISIAIYRRQSEPSLGGQTLMASLLQATRRAMPPGMKHYPAAATRALLDKEPADALAVPPAGSGRVAFRGAQAGTRLFFTQNPDHGRKLASDSTKYLYQYWINQNHGHFPAGRIAGAPDWGLPPAPSRAPAGAPDPEVDPEVEVDLTRDEVVDLPTADEQEVSPTRPADHPN